jgi:hypothetical protein
MSIVKYKPTHVRVALYERGEACLDQVYYTRIFFNKCPEFRAPHIRVHALVDDTHL